MIVCTGSFKPPSTTECRLCSDLESAAMAVARPATTECLLQRGRRPLCASSRAQGRRRPPAVAGSLSCCSEHHCPATAANQRQMHRAACHRRRGLEIQPDLHSFSCFHSLAYSIAYSMFLFVDIAGCYITYVLYSRFKLPSLPRSPYARARGSESGDLLSESQH